MKLFKSVGGDMAILALKKQIKKSATQKVKQISQTVFAKVKNILKPAGEFIGKQIGRDPTIRTISKQEAQKIIDQLIAAGAKELPNPRYPGTWYQLPNGKGFGIRNTNSAASAHYGTSSCINIVDLGAGLHKLKY